jgi:hypothetical protein
MASPLYPILSKFLDDEWIRLERNQITPWAFISSGKPFLCKDFYGKVISYEGVGFEGSPRDVFWGRYIEPFLEDITERAVQKTIKLANEKQQKFNEPLVEVSELLKALISRAYSRMADIDQRLLGKGFPEKIIPRDVSGELFNMECFIDQRIQAELAMSKPQNWFLAFWRKYWQFVLGTILLPILIKIFFG